MGQPHEQVEKSAHTDDRETAEHVRLNPNAAISISTAIQGKRLDGFAPDKRRAKPSRHPVGQNPGKLNVNYPINR
jgi:hypothetical protein